jgi:hypothetical protein
MSRSVLRSTSFAVLFVLLGAASSRTLTHATVNGAIASQLAGANGNGPGGGDPMPPCPNCSPAVH